MSNNPTKLLAHVFSKLFNIGCACGCIPIDFAARRGSKPADRSPAVISPTSANLFGVPWWGHVLVLALVLLIPSAVEKIAPRGPAEPVLFKYYTACGCVAICLIGSASIISKHYMAKKAGSIKTFSSDSSHGDSIAREQLASTDKKRQANLSALDGTGLTNIGDALLQKALVTSLPNLLPP